MFSCFSKKKSKPEPSYQRNVKFPKLPQEQNRSTLIPCPFPDSKPGSTTVSRVELKPKQEQLLIKNERFQSMDNMLKEEIQVVEVEEKTACFNTKPASSRHLPKFQSIYDESHSSEMAQLQKSSQQFSFHQEDQSCNIASLELEDEPVIPNCVVNKTHLISQLENSQGKALLGKSSDCMRLKPEKINNFANLHQVPEFETTFNSNMKESDKTLDTTITLQNFRLKLGKIQKKQDHQQDETLKQTFQQAQNIFYCPQIDLNQQFTRAVVVHQLPQLAKSLFARMTIQEKNKLNSKGYAPVQLVVVKALAQDKYLQLAKLLIYDQQVSLQCRGPEGWTPLQQALIKRSIPLSTHLFRSAYYKKQQKFKQSFSELQRILLQMPNLYLQIEIKVDSLLPLVGALAPSDTLKLKKVGGKIMLEYTLVGYQFPICKRREMGVFFDGDHLYALNNSKGLYCDLLQELDQEEMILLVQDMLSGEIKKGEPIVHEFKLNKSLSLFDNQIKHLIGGYQATKYQLELRYTSTAEKRRSNRDHNEDVSYLKDYGKYRQKKAMLNIQEKNKNKKVQLELWLTQNFGLQLETFLKVIEVLGAGNTLLGKWSSFFREQLRELLSRERLFPVQIDIPLNYSLYFNIKFNKFEQLPADQPELSLKSCLKKIGRKEFQGVTQSRQKRALFLEAYT